MNFMVIDICADLQFLQPKNHAHWGSVQGARLYSYMHRPFHNAQLCWCTKILRARATRRLKVAVTTPSLVNNNKQVIESSDTQAKKGLVEIKCVQLLIPYTLPITLLCVQGVSYQSELVHLLPMKDKITHDQVVPTALNTTFSEPSQLVYVLYIVGHSEPAPTSAPSTG
jgi:hypothetical protein